jgi:lipoprotein-releasing system permease protein
MRLSLTIAYRYLIGKKSTNAINIITWISIIGLSVGTAAVLLILSVFNGFEDLLTGMLSNFNPDIKITLAKGKYEGIDDKKTLQIKAINGIEAMSYCLEETSFFDYKSSQEVGIIKGVDPSFITVTGIDSSIIFGQIKLNKDVKYGLFGITLNTKLSINESDIFSTVNVYMPSLNSGDPLGKSFTSRQFYPSGSFSVGSDIDGQYVIVDIDLVNELLGLENNFSSIEISLSNDSHKKEVIKQLEVLLGPAYIIKDRYQQDESFLKIMNIEKIISYLIACLVLMIIAFNLVGSLWMIVMDKKLDIAILKSMGLTKKSIKNIFLMLGLLVTSIGLILGIIIGLILYYLQKNYGIIGIPDSFLVDAYPIALVWTDFIVVICTVLVIGLLASLLPSYRAGKVEAFIRQE